MAVTAIAWQSIYAQQQTVNLADLRLTGYRQEILAPARNSTSAKKQHNSPVLWA